MQPPEPLPHPGQSRIEIDPEALVSNWRFFGAQAPGARCAAVVKADAYGTGVEVAVPALAEAGCDTFFVAHRTEGEAVRRLVPDAGSRVFVLNGALPGEEVALAQAGLIPVLNTVGQLERWLDRAPGAAAAVHVDTGLNRLGLAPDEAVARADLIEALAPELILSHLACASDPEHPKNAMQRQLFVETAAQLPPAPLSLAASAGVLLGPDYHFDLVRPGIGLYGGGPFDQAHVPLAPVVRLRAPVLQVRQVGPGDTVGYGATWEADRRKSVAIVALGYADGFLRSGSSRGFGVVRGAVLPILGRVSMDLIALDATLAMGAGGGLAEGDLIEFLGPAAPLDAQAQACGTIPYELLTGLSRRAARRLAP
jgi:alanine racemase